MINYDFEELWFWSQHLKCQSKLNRPRKAVRFSIGSQASSAFKDCHDLDSSVRHWLVRAWVQIPFAVIFADISWSWSNLFFLISNLIFYILEVVIASLMGLLAWLLIENRTAFPGLLSLLWLFKCWLQNHK